MQFISRPKDILISIIFKKEIFNKFVYNRERYSLHKFAIEDFMAIVYLFENNKLILDLSVTQSRFMISSFTGKGFNSFVAVPLVCDEDDEELIIQ